MDRAASENPDRAPAWRFRSVCGIDEYDRLATADPAELEAFVRALEANGWIVKATTKLDASTPAYFFPRKSRFYYDPERMTRLDMIHEQVHLESFVRRGHWRLGPRGAQLVEDEVAAYSHELTLLRGAGMAATSYLFYFESRIELYQLLKAQRSRDPD